MFAYNIALIGFMGAGKSTVARRLGELYDMDVVEMDQLIEEREGMRIPEIFAARGEEYFRDQETQLLVELQSRGNVVLSCGGGVVLRERNVREMKKNGRVVLLEARPETILERVKDSDERPLLRGHKNVEDIGALMEARRGRYQAAADITVSTDEKSVEEICEELVRRLREREERHV